MLGRLGRAGGVITGCRFWEGVIPEQEERRAQVPCEPQMKGEFPSGELGAPGAPGRRAPPPPPTHRCLGAIDLRGAQKVPAELREGPSQPVYLTRLSRWAGFHFTFC